MKIKYDFVRMGTKIGNAVPNTIYLDIGGRFQKGIIDHHGFSVEEECHYTKSAASLLYNKGKEYFFQNIDERKEVILTVHEKPDLDCFFSLYFAGYLLKYGTFTPEMQILAEYSERADAGEIAVDISKPISIYTIAALIEKNVLAEFENGLVSKENINIRMVEYGMKLIEDVHKVVTEETLTEIDTIYYSSPEFKEKYLKFGENVDKEIKGYINDKENSYEMSIFLPIEESMKIGRITKGVVYKNAVNSVFSSKLAIASGYGFVISPVFYKIKLAFEGIDIEISRIKIEVNPEKEARLFGLGAKLEIAECQKEIEVFGKLEIINKWRSREKRRFEAEWCTNDNPWYPGSGHGYTVVDSPAGNNENPRGTLLSVEEVNEIISKLIK